MMGSLRQYIISLISASAICSVLKGLFDKSSSSRVIHLLCGTFIIFTFLAPLKSIRFEDMGLRYGLNQSIAHEAVRRGEEFSEKAMADIISAEIASYVEKKASTLGAQIRVEVNVSGDEIPAPIGMYIEGQVSPFIRTQLEAYILENIGLSEEDVRWTGQH